MNSTHYITLTTNISQLTTHFGGAQNGFGVVCPITIAAYKLLAHAEIEQYFECIAGDILQAAVDDHQLIAFNQTTIRAMTLSTLISLTSYAVKTCQSTSQCSTHSSDNIIKLAVIHYREKVLKENHGIKHENIEKLFKPIGYRIEDNYPALISALTSFGQMRGDAAHKSPYITASHDLATVISTVVAIVSQTKPLDEEVMDALC